ncbi:MAG: hypothetical protein P8K07_13385 [Candidatus Binatia bacterium]|nr:hypothetical protein [Candidatus Binatia bacterium]
MLVERNRATRVPDLVGLSEDLPTMASAVAPHLGSIGEVVVIGP